MFAPHSFMCNPASQKLNISTRNSNSVGIEDLSKRRRQVTRQIQRTIMTTKGIATNWSFFSEIRYWISIASDTTLAQRSPFMEYKRNGASTRDSQRGIALQRPQVGTLYLSGTPSQTS
jgi:hypothetical protein